MWRKCRFLSSKGWILISVIMYSSIFLETRYSDYFSNFYSWLLFRWLPFGIWNNSLFNRSYDESVGICQWLFKGMIVCGRRCLFPRVSLLQAMGLFKNSWFFQWEWGNFRNIVCKFTFTIMGQNHNLPICNTSWSFNTVIWYCVIQFISW